MNTIEYINYFFKFKIKINGYVNKFSYYNNNNNEI